MNDQDAKQNWGTTISYLHVIRNNEVQTACHLDVKINLHVKSQDMKLNEY
jgi:hypothetical protein